MSADDDKDSFAGDLQKLLVERFDFFIGEQSLMLLRNSRILLIGEAKKLENTWVGSGDPRKLQRVCGENVSSFSVRKRNAIWETSIR